MDQENLQTLRYKLQRRVRRLNSIDFKVFHYSLKQFWGFIQHNPILTSLLEDLNRREPDAKDIAEKIINGNWYVVDTEDKNAAICFHVLDSCVSSDSSECEINIGHTCCRKINNNECLDFFRTMLIEPLYDYLDEHIDDQRVILAHLVRYKHKCEWFQRDRLYKLWNEEQTKGEKQLVKDLYEYLFDNGVEIIIEPSSASGKPDFISMQAPKDKLIADAKILNPDKSKGKSYIISAFHQIYQYALDYNQPFGYLVIFNTSDQDLKLTFSQQEATVPFVIHNHKAIFFVTIDIYQHDVSASKRGQLKAIELSEDELVQNIQSA